MTDNYTDLERLCLSAVWTGDAVRWLEDEMDQGHVVGTTDVARTKLDTLRDGLQVLADTLHVLTLPFPPPSVPPSPGPHLQLVD